VRSVIGITYAPKLEQLAALDYVETCAFETMRMKPLAPILGVQALA